MPRRRLGRTQAKTSSPSTTTPRSNILDSAPPSVARMAQRLDYCQARNVVAWHRAGFWLFWRHRSRPSLGTAEDAGVRTLIRRMASENPCWGAPRIHGELLKLGFDVSERTVSRYLHACFLPSRHGNAKLRSCAITTKP